MKSFSLALLAAGLLAGQDGNAKSPEAKKKFGEQMKIVGAENKGIKADAEKKDFTKIKERLGRMKAAVGEARKIDYLKNGDKKDDFDSYFEIFLDARMPAFEKAEWNAESFDDLYERIQASCRTCHDAYKE
jgi:hypothetical protein